LNEADTTLDNTQKLGSWKRYHQALLQFYLNNTDKCLLVNASQVKKSAEKYIRQIHQRIDTPIADTFVIENYINSVGNLQFSATNSEMQEFAEPAEDPLNILYQQFTSVMLEHDVDLMQLYETLQAAASIPYSYATRKSSLVLNLQHIQSAWQQQQGIKIDLQEALLSKGVLEQEKFNLQQNLDQLNDQLSNSLSQKQELKQQYQVLNNNLVQSVQEKQMLEQETDMLLTQLHQVQEAFEKTQFKKEDNSNTYEKLSTSDSKEMLKQLHSVQEELERIFIEGVNTHGMEVGNSLDHPRLGAENIIKQQLAYRLGSILVRHSSSFFGYMTMGWALLIAWYKFNKQEKLRVKNKQELLPISYYVDAYKAKKIKQQLTYKLGRLLIHQMRGFWRKLFFPITFFVIFPLAAIPMIKKHKQLNA
jgi:hypothetical protein